MEWVFKRDGLPLNLSGFKLFCISTWHCPFLMTVWHFSTGFGRISDLDTCILDS